MSKYISLDRVKEVFDYAEREFCECEYVVKNIREAVEQLPAADVNPVRWIAVEEQLPETYKLVLALTESGHHVLAALYENFGAWFELWAGTKVNVTHWMSLPEPPNCNANTMEEWVNG